MFSNNHNILYLLLIFFFNIKIKSKLKSHIINYNNYIYDNNGSYHVLF